MDDSSSILVSSNTIFFLFFNLAYAHLPNCTKDLTGRLFMWQCGVVVRAAACDPVNRGSTHAKYLSFSI